MSIEQNITSALKELSASQGGSLVKEVVKAKMKPGPTIFISLGGLGGKTLERLKSIIKDEYEDNPHCAFLAVDTALNDLEERKGLDLREKFAIFDQTCVTLPSNPPQVVKKWLNPEFPKNNLKDTGAEGVRQVARLMLCGTDKYNQLRDRIRQIIKEVYADSPAAHNWIRINLIAGISGGTGSGTVVDVAYMIHDIMNRIFKTHSYELRGFFYLPDVQANVPEISRNVAIWNTLQRNGYAALKEIDYFMSNGADGIIEPIYKLETLNEEISSSKKIFETANCMLISSTPTAGKSSDNVDESIDRLSRFIAYVYTDMSSITSSTPSDKAGAQDILSTMCNFVRSILPSWKNDNVHGIETDNPNWAGYHYSAIGYSSMYIPRDEIFAYCANLVFEKMYDDWNNITTLNQENIDQQLADKKLDSVENLFRFIKKQVNSIVHTNFRIKKDDPSYPEVVKVLGVGKTKNTDETMEEAKNRAQKFNKSLNTPATLDAIVKSISDEILSIVKSYFNLYGPFYAIAMLSGLKNNDIKGFLQQIEGYKQNLPNLISTLNKNMEAANATMEQEGESRRNDIIPTEEETEEFVTACENYTTSCANLYLAKKLENIINKVYDKLNEENSKTYEVYTTTIEVLGNMLHKDSIFATDTARNVNGKGETFYFDAIGFKKSDAMRKKFLELFGNVIDDDHAQKLAEEFKNNMFSNETIKIWKSAGEDREAFAQNIRELFKSFFAEYTTDTLEKFIVLANTDMQGLTPKRLTEIWDATPATSPEDCNFRNNLIDSVADTLFMQLRSSSTIMMRSNISASHINSFPSFSLVCLIDSMPKINEAMQRLHPDASFAEVDRDFKSSITMFEMRGGIPAATIVGMNEYATQYYRSEQKPSTKIGRHMNEGSQKWDIYLPETYGLDADAFYSSAKHVVPGLMIESLDEFNDFKNMKKIRGYVKMGLDNGWICADNMQNPTHYNIYRVMKVHDGYKRFKEILEEKLLDGSFNSIWAIASDSNSGVSVKSIGILPVDSSDNDLDVLDIPTNDYDFFDIHRVIRKNMNLMTDLFASADEYSKSDNIIAVYNEVKAKVQSMKTEADRKATFAVDVNNFAKMFCFDLIRFDKSSNVWLYRSRPTADFKPFVPLNKGMMSVDKSAIHYLAFAKGYVENRELLAPAIEALSNPVAPKDVYDKAHEFLTGDYMTNPVIEERYKDLENAVAISPYKEYYSYPYSPNGKDSTYRNLSEFYELFVEYLKNYLE